MQQGIIRLCQALYPAVRNTLVTLTHPYLLVTFRLKPFFSGI